MTIKIRGIELNYDEAGDISTVIVRFDYTDNVERVYINGNIAITYDEYVQNAQITKLASFTKLKVVELFNRE